MSRFFNIAGPCNPADHYMLPPLPRLPMVRRLIERKAYFVLHAPRQSGKSTALGTLSQALTSEGRHAAVLLTMEVGAGRPLDLDAAELAILSSWRDDIRHQLPAELHPPPWPDAAPGNRIGAALSAWARACPRKLVVFLDEIDAIQEDQLISVLRQLRAGFSRRPQDFPWSLALCGMRDVRDYKVASGGSERLHTASPFNIKDASLTLLNFTRQEIAALYGQHSADTGQVFDEAAIDEVYALTQGQPWLVNALARVMVEDLAPDPGTCLQSEHVRQAREQLIQRRDAHLDSLAERLREPRIRRIIDPILVGAFPSMDMMNDDLLYARDMGLIVDRPSVRIANPLYQELIPRALTYLMQSFFPHQTAWYLRPDGSLDMEAMLRAFQRFFAEQSESWLGRFDYQEAGPHLMLMAFLQRVVNGGGSIQREFALGSGRADLLVTWRGTRHVLELKVRRSERTLQEGLEQLGGYLSRLGEPGGFLVLFDRRDRPWEERLFQSAATAPGGQQVIVFGL